MVYALPSLLCCALGASCACASAASTVIGMLLQKEGLARENRTIVRLGLFIFIVVKPGAQYVAVLLAPVSLVAPLASVAILLNAVLVPWCRAEKLSSRDMWAGAILVLGCIGAMASGPRDTELLTLPELRELAFESRGFTIALGSLMLILVAKLYITWSRASKDDTAASRSGLGVIWAAFVPSLASAFNNVVVKILLNGVLSGPGMILLPLVAGLVCTAALQVWSTSVGVQLFDMLVYVPVQVASQIFITVAYGSIFFKEAPTNPSVFIMCTLAIGLGVLVSQSRPADCEGYHEIKDRPDDKGCRSPQNRRDDPLLGA